MTWTIRPAVPSDAPAVLALWRLAEAEVSATEDVASVETLLARD